jgi:hypothetical protein
MVEQNTHFPEVNTLASSNRDVPGDREARPPRLTRKMAFLLLLTLAAIAVIIVLALIGPVAGGDIGIVLSL